MHSLILSHHSCGTLCHFSFRGVVNICDVVIALITIISVFPFVGVIGVIVGVVSRSVLILEEWAPVSVSNVEAPVIAACKAMHDIDYVLFRGGGGVQKKRSNFE